jgi:hypothetical protein
MIKGKAKNTTASEQSQNIIKIVETIKKCIHCISKIQIGTGHSILMEGLT